MGLIIFCIAGYLAAKRHLPALCPLFWKAVAIYVVVSVLMAFGEVNQYRYAHHLSDAQYDALIANYRPQAIASWLMTTPVCVAFYFLARLVCKFFFKGTAPSNSTAEPAPAEEKQPAPVSQMAVPKWSEEHRPMGKIKTTSEKQ